MTFFRFRAPMPVSLALMAITTAACRDTTGPVTADVAVVPSAVSPAVMLKAKKSSPVIQSLELSTTTIDLNDGSAALFFVTLSNPVSRTSRTYTDVYLQGELRQGAVVAPTGGGQIACGDGPYAVLPLGTCVVYQRTISTIPGAAILSSGPATFAVTLYSQSGAFQPYTATTPVILGEALVTP